jgi:hypothetical protein
MQLRLLTVLVACLSITSVVAAAQMVGSGTVTISGAEQGPVYPCGRRSCPTYDSGQITITVNGFIAATNYSNNQGQRNSEQLASILAAKLNTSASPVTALASNTKITLTSKVADASSNYPLSTQVTHSWLFAKASFTATPSGSTLSGGSGGPAPVGTVIKQTANNTSLCSSASDPGGNLAYCSALFNGFNTNANNTSAQTLVPDSPAGHLSNISIRQLMYSGWTGRMICEYQPWFGLSTHKSVGYNENSAATVNAQDSFMIAEGCDINLIDWYGSLDANQSFNLTTANTVFADLNGRSGYPMQYGIMEDKGALKSSCPTSGQTESSTVTCLEGALIQDMDYINVHYASSPVYWTDAGQPVVVSFVTQSDWPVLTSTDWSTIWSAVKAHTDTYAARFKYIFQFGAFTTASYDNGRFGWVQPPAFTATQQFWWGSVTSASPTYLDALYSAGLSHPSQITIGALWKGFDDNAASWGSNRVIAQQCGQVLLKTANEISKYFGGSNPQIPYVQMVTWNDYEEGTAVEGGIDNCYTVNASLAGSILSWSLTASDSTYASTSTIHHYTVYYGDASGNLYLAASNLPVTTNSLDLSSRVPGGTWNIYVEMVGKPLIINQMSDPVTFIH